MNNDLALLIVRVGDPVTVELWDAMRSAVARRTLARGLNTRMDYMPNCTVVHFDPPEIEWLHSWLVSLSGDRVKIRGGLMNGYEPKIGAVPLSGDDRNPVPMLALDLGKYDGEGRSWICVRVARAGDEVEAADKINPEQLTIVQVAVVPGLSSGGYLDVDGVALWPIAVMKRRVDQPRDYGSVHQIAMFDVTHRYSVVSRLHFFPVA